MERACRGGRPCQPKRWNCCSALDETTPQPIHMFGSAGGTTSFISTLLMPSYRAPRCQRCWRYTTGKDLAHFPSCV